MMTVWIPGLVFGSRNLKWANSFLDWHLDWRQTPHQELSRIETYHSGMTSFPSSHESAKHFPFVLSRTSLDSCHSSSWASM